MPDFYVVPYGGHWSAPLMVAALAGVVHDRQSANDSDRNRRHCNHQRGFHGALAIAGPSTLPTISLSQFNEPTVNARIYRRSKSLGRFGLSALGRHPKSAKKPPVAQGKTVDSFLPWPLAASGQNASVESLRINVR
jgi:hypothetical protein